MLEDDGDIIKALGFVALNAAYLEEQIDDLLFLLHPIEKFSDAKQRFWISKKIKFAKDILTEINKGEFQILIGDLDICSELFDHRNELIHGRIYANYSRPDTLRSGRQGIPEREVTSKELYDLANDFNEIRLKIYRPMIFKIPREIKSFLKER